jgi:hypothetical protein
MFAKMHVTCVLKDVHEIMYVTLWSSKTYKIRWLCAKVRQSVAATNCMANKSCATLWPSLARKRLYAM